MELLWQIFIVVVDVTYTGRFFPKKGKISTSSQSNTTITSVSNSGFKDLT